jgi:hypothetical protein
MQWSTACILKSAFENLDVDDMIITGDDERDCTVEGKIGEGI